MSPSARYPRLPLLAAFALAGLSLVQLGQPPLGPEEAGSGPGGWAASELAARLPSVAAAGLTAFLITARAGAAGAGPAGLLATAFSPALLALAREAGTLAWAAFALAVACALSARRAIAARALAAACAALTFLLVAGPLHAEQASARIALALWGMLFGHALPPWRWDVAVPTLAVALPLAWQGLGTHPAARAGRLALLALAAALLALTAPRPEAAALRGALLSPVLLLAIARGSKHLPAAVPRLPLAAVALAAGLVSWGNLLLARDVLDPSRRVPWDEAARLLAVLDEGDTRIVASPSPPPAIEHYAGRSGPAMSWSRADAVLGELTTSPRVIVLSYGLEGGLSTPASALEEALVTRDYGLKGTIDLGEIEPGLLRLAPALGIATPASHYLRIRRYQRAATSTALEPPP